MYNIGRYRTEERGANCGNCNYPSDCAEDENGMDDIARLNDPTYYMGKDCEECAVRAPYNKRF